MTWRGTITRNGGELRHEGEPDAVLRLKVGEIKAGCRVALTGILGEEHWTGEVSADRKTFALNCPLGFTLSGSLDRGDAGFLVRDVAMIPPPSCLLPGEAAE
jgi:hypothetical protein